MIHRTIPAEQNTSWRQQLATGIRSVHELLEVLNLRGSGLDTDADACRLFPLRVPRAFINKMEKGNPADPLLLQILPRTSELLAVNGFTDDPVGDLSAGKRPGIIKKYHGRALLTLTGSCAIHCRYCFRRNFPYGRENPINSNLQETLDYLNSDSKISEIILSGGDPLSLPDNRLSEIVRELEYVPHIRTLRIHTRLPVVIPDRITSSLIDWISKSRFDVVMVTHVNHPNEIDGYTANRIKLLHGHAKTILNQSVLLRGVNDSPDTLCQLSDRLFSAGILPYYLHQMDRVQGAAHFEVPIREAVSILREVAQRLAGYLVPRLVYEQAGALAKIPLADKLIDDSEQYCSLRQDTTGCPEH